jgi:hypothetical protein
MKKEPKPKFKIGDVIDSRIICDIIIDENSVGKLVVSYGYRYKHEREDIDLLWCQESTLYRHCYNRGINWKKEN